MIDEDQLEWLPGRNPVIECLARGRRKPRGILLDEGAKLDKRIQRICDLAAQLEVELTRVPRGELDRVTDGATHQGVAALVPPLVGPDLLDLFDELVERGVTAPLFVLANQLAYEQNLGAILRSSLGFGVNGVIVPNDRGAPLSTVAQRVAMGAAEEVPVVRQSLVGALKLLRKRGVRAIGADVNGKPPTQVDLTGPIALVMGSEGQGLTGALRHQCDDIVSIPLAGDLESLNVSVATGMLLYEKRRQDGWFDADQ